MNISKMYPHPHPQTAGRVIDGEAVLILADSSEINVLNPVGSIVFELADGTHSVADIVTTVTEQFDVTTEQATEDVLTFLEELKNQQVMVIEEK